MNWSLNLQYTYCILKYFFCIINEVNTANTSIFQDKKYKVIACRDGFGIIDSIEISW